MADLEAKAIRLLQKHEPPNGYYGCFSGGKDSCVIKHLAHKAGVTTKWYYNVTTIDPPELVQFVKLHTDVHRIPPSRGNFFLRMEKKRCIPTRKIRWCCSEYKERGIPEGTIAIMGIRKEESPARKRWREVDVHENSGSKVVLPILEWDSEFLWDYIHQEEIPYCILYDEGFHRLGCIGCPKASRSARVREFARWPGFERRWKLSFKRIWDVRAGTNQRNGKEWFGSAIFKSWEEMWEWWNLNLWFPSVEEWNSPPKKWLSCFVCGRSITVRRFKDYGRICKLCAGIVTHKGPIDMGGVVVRKVES